MHIQRITTPSGEEMVLLSRADYDALVEAANAAAEALEDAAEAAMFEQRMAELDKGNVFPPELSAYITKGDRRLRAIRRWRGLSQVQLAEAAGIAQGFLSDLETGQRRVTSQVADRLAKALDVKPSWLED